MKSKNYFFPTVLIYCVKALRPKQWVKNILVAAAPIASGEFFSNFFQILMALSAFMFASSFGYLFNDWKDRKSDLMHPDKMSRPFASGILRFKHFVVLSFFCLSLFVVSLLFLPPNFKFIIALYLLITLLYTYRIKFIPVLEMIWLSSGFLIRALAGSLIIGEAPTGWFVTSVFFGSLFLVSGKRSAELRNLGDSRVRKVIDSYSQGYLSAISNSSLSITVTTYCLWVFDVHGNSPLAQISILPFTFTVLTYLLSCERGNGETPEKLLFSNKYLIIGMAVTVSLLLAVFYS